MFSVRNCRWCVRVWRRPLFLLTIALSSNVATGGELKGDDPQAFRQSTDQQCDLAVYGSTPGGVACAVRAAREGLNVILVTHAQHLGGMMTNGLSIMDTLYSGSRAPIYDELRRSIPRYYANRYGQDSPQYRATLPGHPKLRYEAGVVERLIDELLAAEPHISIVKAFYPIEASRESSLLKSVTFRQMEGDRTLTVTAVAFADCSYEADLAAVARTPYRVGREARSEFNEPHGGVIYMRKVEWPPKDVDVVNFSEERRLNLFQYDAYYETIPEVSTGEADPAVQGYNMRMIVTNDPENRVPIDQPANYDPEIYRSFSIGQSRRPGLEMPNRKAGLNDPKLVGRQDAYVEGDWATRREVTRQHVEATLGLLYYRQNDPSVPPAIREGWKEWGLPRDEFPDNGHVPYEMYARETRRIRGRAIFTEHDARLAPDLKRAPIHADSIGATEWFLDSHACTPRHVDGSEPEGMVMLKNQTFPGQVSLRTIIPEDCDNLLVPVCLSSTHVGWGTIRLEPTWMMLCESAAYVVVTAKQNGVSPAAVDSVPLIRRLADSRIMISFFNDIEGKEHAEWYPAVQYLGTQGFFGSYDARPYDALLEHLADAWIAHVGRRSPSHDDPTATARKMLAAEQNRGDPIVARAFVRRLSDSLAERIPAADLVDRLREWNIAADQPITRGDASRLIYTAEALSAAAVRNGLR
ncbi:MAG: FAD-dependent oxidoreductase [Planctomycetaceae bacterium]